MKRNLMIDNIVEVNFRDISLGFDKNISFFDLPSILQYLTEIYDSEIIDNDIKVKIKKYLENYILDTEIMANYLEKIYNKFLT